MSGNAERPPRPRRRAAPPEALGALSLDEPRQRAPIDEPRQRAPIDEPKQRAPIDEPKQRAPIDEPKQRAPEGVGGLPAQTSDDEHYRRLARARQVRLAKVGALAVALLVLISFVLDNARPVEVRFLAWTFSMPLVWIVAVVLVLGGALGYLVGRPRPDLSLHDRELSLRIGEGRGKRFRAKGS